MIKKTTQGKIEIYPFKIHHAEPKGLELSAFVISQEEFDNLLEEMIVFKVKMLKTQDKIC